ncbi:MAG: HPF/RaiA family ribosome-associated protein [Pirellulaceae bacterium]|nr:HPF/RaiA family ribosome-associated protein [Pirellulaceae bacterium]
MQLCIHAHGIDLTERIKRQVYEKLDLALDRLEQQITSISIYLVDTNGPLLGRIDKACRIVVQIENQEPLIVEDCDESVDVVIERTTDRLGVAACQRFEALYGKQKKIHRLLSYENLNLPHEGFVEHDPV